MLETYLGAWVLDPAASEASDDDALARAVHCLIPTTNKI